jgi:outer membrane protein assembly factor BamE
MNHPASLSPRLRAALFCVALLAGCGYVPRIPGLTPYRIDIQQGNYVTQEMMSQLKAGMTKDQVRAVLGTPLLTDIFHADRWDYVYWREAADGKREQRKVAVFFQDGKLSRIDGDVVAAAPKEEAK